MIEGRNLIDIQRKEAEARFAQEVAEVIGSDPMSVTKPLKYKIGSSVLFKETNDVAKVERGNFGIYLLHLKSGEFTTCKESDIATIH